MFGQRTLHTAKHRTLSLVVDMALSTRIISQDYFVDAHDTQQGAPYT